MLTAAEILEWDSGAMPERKRLLEASGLVRHFVRRSGLLRHKTTIRAVDGADIDVAAGETLAVLGERGAGKSTLLALLSGALVGDAGTLRLDGQVLGSRELTLRGYMRQVCWLIRQGRPWLDESLRVERLVARALRTRGERRRSARRRVPELLRRVGLDPARAARLSPSDLTPVDRRRVAFARMLALEPRVVLLDDPFAGLAEQEASELGDLLMRLGHEHGLAYVIAEQRANATPLLADRVVVLHNGHVVESGPLALMKDHAVHPLTGLLLGGAPAGREGDAPSTEIDAPSRGCPFHPRCRFSEVVCTFAAPPLQPFGVQHRVACHRANPMSGHRRLAALPSPG